MKKKLSLVFILISVIFVSCNEQNVSDKETEIVEEEILDDFEEEYVKPIKYKGTKTHLKLINNCNEKNYPDEELLSKYAKKQAYDINITEKGKRIIIEFSFLDDCCTRHSADVEFLDTVKINTLQIGNEVCECYCNYRYSISLNKEKIGNKKIKINNWDILNLLK